MTNSIRPRRQQLGDRNTQPLTALSRENKREIKKIIGAVSTVPRTRHMTCEPPNPQQAACLHVKMKEQIDNARLSYYNDSTLSVARTSSIFRLQAGQLPFNFSLMRTSRVGEARCAAGSSD